MLTYFLVGNCSKVLLRIFNSFHVKCIEKEAQIFSYFITLRLFCQCFIFIKYNIYKTGFRMCLTEYKMRYLH